MNPKTSLCFLVCENFQREAAAVLKDKGFSGVSFKVFHADCGHPILKPERIMQCVGARQEDGSLPGTVTLASPLQPSPQQIHLLGGCCLSGLSQTVELPPDWHLHLLEQCFTLFTSPEIVTQYIKEGAYLLTPGYLARWEQNLIEMGLDQETARQMYAETTRKLVLLDTGVDPRAKDHLQQFAEYLALPSEVLPVGLDAFRLLLEKLTLQWMLQKQQSTTDELSHQVEQQQADYAMTLDIISRLTASTNEDEAIELTLDLFAMLFAPRVLVYSQITGQRSQTFDAASGNIHSRSEKGQGREIIQELQGWINDTNDWKELEDGFLLRIQHQQETLGILALRQLALPEYMPRYLNAALQVAQVCGLVIANLRTLQRLLFSQQMAGLGTLAAGVAHELNSPLQVITGTSGSLFQRYMEKRDDRLLESRLENINRNAWRVSEIVRSLLTYARSSPQTLEPDDLNAIVRDTLLLIENQLKNWANISIHTDLQPALPPIPCDRSKLSQALINLLTNAQDAMPLGGEIIIRTRRDPQQKEQTVSISDNGDGIPPEIQDKVFNPFFTTKPLGKGTGLGLSIVQGIVQAHNGRIELHSTPGKGTTIDLTFPEAAAPLPVQDNSKLGRFDDDF